MSATNLTVSVRSVFETWQMFYPWSEDVHMIRNYRQINFPLLLTCKRRRFTITYAEGYYLSAILPKIWFRTFLNFADVLLMD